MKGRVAWLHSPCALIKCYYNSANNRRYFMVELKGRKFGNSRSGPVTDWQHLIPLCKAHLLT